MRAVLILLSYAATANLVARATLTTSFSKSVPGKATIMSFYDILWNCFDSDKDTSTCLKSQVLFLLEGSMKNEAVSFLKMAPIRKMMETQSKDAQEDDEDEDEDIAEDVIAGGIEELRSLSLVNDQGRKKKGKGLGQAITIAFLTVVMIMGPLAYKAIALLATKALILSKLAFVLSAIGAFKKYVHRNSEYEKRARSITVGHLPSNVLPTIPRDITTNSSFS